MAPVPFVNMHGLGNDFVVVDSRAAPFVVSNGAARAIADRRAGIGFEQLITLEVSSRADAFIRVHNADGGEVAACGNGTRCVAKLLMAESGRDEVTIETRAGLLQASDRGGLITVDMGPPRLGWREIPLARESDTLHLDLEAAAASGLGQAVGVNVGNPHAVFFVADADAVDLAAIGPALEHDPLFPERANVSVATVRAPDSLRLRVWERGAGITRACGTAACAALVAASERGLLARAAEIVVDGGTLGVAWREDGHVLLTGPAATSFSGSFDAALIEEAHA